MFRIYVQFLALACLLVAVPTTRAAVHHMVLNANHVVNKTEGKYAVAKTHLGHTISTTHGPQGKVQSVHVGKGAHTKVHKIKGNPHPNAKSPKSASAMDTDRTNLLTGSNYESPVSFQGGQQAATVLRCSRRSSNYESPVSFQGGAFTFIAFVIQFDGHTFVILIPIQFVAQPVVAAADPNPPEDPGCNDGDNPQVRLKQSPWECNSTFSFSGGLDVAALTSSEHRMRF